MVMGKLDIGPRPATLTPKDKIIRATVQCVEVGTNISTTLSCSMLEKVLMEIREVALGIGTSLIPPSIQVIMVDHLVL